MGGYAAGSAGLPSNGSSRVSHCPWPGTLSKHSANASISLQGRTSKPLSLRARACGAARGLHHKSNQDTSYSCATIVTQSGYNFGFIREVCVWVGARQAWEHAVGNPTAVHPYCKRGATVLLRYHSHGHRDAHGSDTVAIPLQYRCTTVVLPWRQRRMADFTEGLLAPKIWAVARILA